MKTILIDCDGVLVDWVHSFNLWMNLRGYQQKVDDTYAIEDRFQIEKEKSYKLVNEFMSSPDLAWLRPQPRAIECIRDLHFRYGYNFVVISSMQVTESAYRYRMDNLRRLFGPEPITRLILTGLTDSKEEALSEWKDSGLYWIEDKISNADLGGTLGLKPIVFDQPWNQEETRWPRAKNWLNLKNMLISPEAIE